MMMMMTTTSTTAGGTISRQLPGGVRRAGIVFKSQSYLRASAQEHAFVKCAQPT